MKSVLISLIVLCLTVGAVTVNSLWTSKKLNELIDMISLSQNTFDISELKIKWENVEPYLSLTTHRRELKNIEHSLNDMYLALTNNDEFAYDEAKSSATELMYEVLRSQCFDWKSII